MGFGNYNDPHLLHWQRDCLSLSHQGLPSDSGLIPGSGRSPGEGSSNILQYPCLGNPMDRAWQATVHGVPRVGHDSATKPPSPPSMKKEVSLKSVAQSSELGG